MCSSDLVFVGARAEDPDLDAALAALGSLPNVHLLGAKADDAPSLLAAAGEFVLEGLWAQKKVGRSDDRGFVAAERRNDLELDLQRLERLRKLKKQVN